MQSAQLINHRGHVVADTTVLEETIDRTNGGESNLEGDGVGIRG